MSHAVPWSLSLLTDDVNTMLVGHSVMVKIIFFFICLTHIYSITFLTEKISLGIMAIAVAPVISSSQFSIINCPSWSYSNLLLEYLKHGIAIYTLLQKKQKLHQKASSFVLKWINPTLLKIKTYVFTYFFYNRDLLFIQMLKWYFKFRQFK